MQLLRRGSKALEDALFDEEMWADVRKRIMTAMQPIMREAFLEGAELATFAVPVKAELPFDLDAVNDAATQHLSNYENRFWERINRTQRDALRSAIIRANEHGLGVDAVIKDIAPLFGEQRARAWAITETTNMIGAGALATYAAAGMSGWMWRTVGDARVDPICEGRSGEVYPLSFPFDAAHTGCRCWPDPVL